ncbi:hypothetical protein DICSQDRAFT_147971 [Dichomitus squalens LYAD-421 SS1]|uniref:NAD(P)-binding protein n=1 Tax=Dichomitus squalens (strain LYAD-421) TaxID=732165 RepID=R7SX52_DICSQ|nr:uncharacterized protein DICSQDRAFT_147971 [Dichomitus squalens LYAD-421 SS1]EJF60300.1 hypothetical protein DICSQDRAFT_147971 [Dichomitus squalens LYAD-421 SS1]
MTPERSAASGGAKSAISRVNDKGIGKGGLKSTRVTAAEGQTGRLAVDLLVNDEDYSSKYEGLTALEYDTVKNIVYDLNDEEMLVKSMEHINTCLLILPARKLTFTRTLLSATRTAKTVTNLVLLSSAGAEHADPTTQPRLHESIALEALALRPKGETAAGDTGHSLCVIRAGLYAENLLHYTQEAPGAGTPQIPIGERHKFAPVAFRDVAQLLAYVITNAGLHGLGDNVRGPQLVSGDELGVVASQAPGTNMEFELIDEETAKIILNTDQGAEVDEAEREYLLEYYSLAREGKTNNTATTAFLAYFGRRGQELTEFFQTYAGAWWEEFRPKRRKVAGGGVKVEAAEDGDENDDDEGMTDESVVKESRRQTVTKGL